MSRTIPFSDVLNQQFVGDMTVARVLITLGISCVLGLFIMLVYRKTFAGVIYSRSFELSLVMMAMVTSLIILPITSNLSLSLGMVGALSIVRFRTAVKDAMDTMHMFWCVAAGICTGAGFFALACIGSLLIALAMVLITGLKIRSSMPFLLVLHFSEDATAEVRRRLVEFPKCKLKSKTVRGESVEMTVEVQLQDGQDGIVDRFTKIPGVFDASLISYQGDFVS